MIRLTEREAEVIQLSALLMTDSEIAEKLGVSVRAVGTRAMRAQSRLGVNCRAHAVALLLASKVIEGPGLVDVRVVAPGSRLAEFAEDYMIYERRGLDRRQIAKVMGYRNGKVVGRLVSRARAAGLLPRPGGRSS